MTLFQKLGQSLETLTFRFDSSEAIMASIDRASIATARQVRNCPNGLYIPGLVQPLDGRTAFQPLFPRLKAIRVQSDDQDRNDYKVGNLYLLVHHAPCLLELDLRAVKMDIAAYMATLDIFQSMDHIQVEILRFDLAHQYSVGLQHPSSAQQDTIEIALDCLTQSGRVLTSLRQLSILAFGAILPLDNIAMVRSNLIHDLD